LQTLKFQFDALKLKQAEYFCTMIDKLESYRDRFKVLEERLSDPEVVGDQKEFTKLHKEYKRITPIVKGYEKWMGLNEEMNQARELLNEKDEAVREMAKEEIRDLDSRIEELETELKTLLQPRDPEDDNDAIFEIRAGTGGDEAAIFAGDLYKMYTSFFEDMGWKYDIASLSEGSVGGFSRIVMEIKGEGVYGMLKYESGTHRVQRVPQTESQGRVHTSAATVAVLPQVEEDEIDLNKEDIRVDTFRSSGAGGQHVNKTDSGVRMTHIPTGISVESTDSRSQIKNREFALQRLYQKIKIVQREKEQSTRAEQRKSLVGTGDRSGKIRTYNFPQNRLTDHRINLTMYNLDQIIGGKLAEVIEALKIADNAEKQKAG
jgi:peptide chain release factor 1